VVIINQLLYKKKWKRASVLTFTDARVGFMTFNATLNNITVLSFVDTRVPGENHRPVTSN